MTDDGSGTEGVTPGTLHTYMVQRWTMRIGHPLTFSGGERIVAVLSSAPALASSHTDVEVTFLVELPGAERP